jgi:anti-sigma B factor antagonist
MQVAMEDLDERTRALSIAGELVGSSGARLVRTLQSAFEQPVERILIDLTGMTFMDSGGLAALIACWSTTREAGARFAVVLAPESHASRSLELRGVADVFAVAGTRDEALTLLG